MRSTYYRRWGKRAFDVLVQKAWRMPRFFFKLHFDGDVARDPIGIEVSDLNHAIAEAEKARAEIIDEEALDLLWLEILDGSGRVLAKVGQA